MWEKYQAIIIYPKGGGSSCFEGEEKYSDNVEYRRRDNGDTITGRRGGEGDVLQLKLFLG